MTKQAAQALANTLMANHMAPADTGEEVTILAHDPAGDMGPEEGYSLVWDPEDFEWKVFNGLAPDATHVSNDVGYAIKMDAKKAQA